MDRAQEFLDYFRNVRQRTMRVAEIIPVEKFETAPLGHGFTCGDILRHIAGTERYMFAENAAGRPSRYSGHDATRASGRIETLEYVTGLHEEAMEIFASLGNEGMSRRCTTPGGATMSVWKWLRSMVEHEAHHRGQLYLYLSHLGVPAPPLYGLTSEEVIERSLS